MWQNEQFITDNKGGIFKNRQQQSSFRKKKVIKNEEVVILNKKKRIEPAAEERIHPGHEGLVRPILDAGELVGIVYECSCGEVAKIMFEFEEHVNRAAG